MLILTSRECYWNAVLESLSNEAKKVMSQENVDQSLLNFANVGRTLIKRSLNAISNVK